MSAYHSKRLSNNSNRRHQSAAASMFETMESRTMMSMSHHIPAYPIVLVPTAPTIINGVLTVTGTNANDTISVSKDAFGMFDVDVDGYGHKYFTTGINQVTVNTLKGNDNVTIGAGMDVSVTVQSGTPSNLRRPPLVPTAPTVINGVLGITGTDYDDEISINQDFTGMYAAAVDGYAHHFGPVGITKIDVSTLGGNDTVAIGAGMAVPVSIHTAAA